MKVEKNLGTTGRPRCFCVDGALDKALDVFWRKGYDGTSLSDLTEAMGINRPSLYATYGNKEELFIKVLDRYAERYGSFVTDALERPNVSEAIEGLLKGGVCGLSSSDHPRGCLNVQGALACSDSAETMKNELGRRRGMVQSLIQQRLEKAQTEGQLSNDSDPKALAAFVATVLHGMSIQANGGATTEELAGIADVALTTFKTYLG
jgi:AcrR family transcriptional regulator